MLAAIDRALDDEAVIIVALGHIYEHATVISGSSGSGYQLLDNDGLRGIDNDSIGIRRATRRHRWVEFMC
ncbi:MAG: hypothetical protein DI498_13305 [Paracoccus denitrificans]|nr:MAG: hypothetical protein DI498_13305 [Paracoccus denitrificans]PZO83062.1 MAG: hypothetical protein DI633_13305 [Paracoccus denitrificans]